MKGIFIAPGRAVDALTLLFSSLLSFGLLFSGRLRLLALLVTLPAPTR